jgi:hypothetical protein
MSMKHGRLRLIARGCAIIAVALVIGFGLLETALRVFPGLIGLTLLQEFEPTLRSEIAARLGQPTLYAARFIPSNERTDGGLPFYTSGPNATAISFPDPADLAFGAVGYVEMDENGLCNPPDKAARGKADVLLAGDSFTFCTEVAPTDTASHKLEEMSGLLTYNLGVGSSGPYEYLEMLKRFAQFKPRAAVFNVYEGNDLRDIILDRRFVESGGKTLRSRLSRAPAWSYAVEYFKACYQVARRYVLANVIAFQEYDFRYSAPVGDHVMAMNVSNKDAGEVERAIELKQGKISTDFFAPPVRAFVVWAKANGIIPIVTYIPSMYSAYEGKVVFSDPQVGTAVQAFSAAQRKWFADNASIIGYNYVDMTPYFQEAAAKGVITHFPSNVHLTAQGQEVVAVHVWDMLRKLGVTSTQ